MSTTILLCLVVLVLGGLSFVLPQLTRPDLFFGVTVDPEFRKTDVARRILRHYRLLLWASAIAAVLVGLASHRFRIAMLLFGAAFYGALATAHRWTQAYALKQRPAPVQIDLSAPRERIPGGLVALLLPIGLLAALGGWALSHPDQLPARLPVQWGFRGPDRWVLTSTQAVVGLLLQHALLCLVLVGLTLGVFHWSRRIASSGPAAAAERYVRRRTAWLLLTIEYFMILPPAFSLLQAPALAMQIWILALPVMLLLFVLGLMRAGQGGTRRLTPARR